VKNLNEFIAYAKANPGKIKYGSTGIGSAAHLASLVFEKQVGIKMTHIPYRGMAPAFTDLLGGHLDLCLATPSSSAPHANNDKVRLIAITSDKRNSQLPQVPTTAEAGTPFTFASWWGMVGPKGLPAPIVERLRKAVAEASALPIVNEKANTNAMHLVPAFGDDFQKLVVKDLGVYKALADSEKLVIEE
jgi:tripartite-type tricarboxylate transporter receptor subunit TctC